MYLPWEASAELMDQLTATLQEPPRLSKFFSLHSYIQLPEAVKVPEGMADF